MVFQRRSYRDPSDVTLILNLLNVVSENDEHMVMPYDLSFSQFDQPQDMSLWEGGSGTLAGFAAIQVRSGALDFAVSPDLGDERLESEILNWAIGRGQEIAAEKGMEHLPFYPGAHEDQTHMIALLEDHGFERSGNWSGAYLVRSLDSPPDEPLLPPMNVIRPFAGEIEAAEHVQLQRTVFNSNHMTIEWRLRVVRMPQYIRDLDLVAVAPDGRLVGFCVCWLHPEGGAGEIDLMGVHPEFRRQGLGRALLLEGLRRMRARGCQTAYVHTGSKNSPARSLYESVGFRQRYLLHSYSRPARL